MKDKLMMFFIFFLYTMVIIHGTLYFNVKHTNNVAYELLVMANELNARIAALSEYIEEQELKRIELMSARPKVDTSILLEGEEDQ